MEVEDIIVALIDEMNRHGGYTAELLERAACDIDALRAQVSALQTEAKHWKDQHANEVRRAKILKDTTDLPLERVRAYEMMGELQGQVERLQKEVVRLDNQARSAECRTFRYGEEAKASEERAEAAGCERDQLRAEVERLKLVETETALSAIWFGLSHTAKLPETWQAFLADITTSYEKGAGSMRERAAKVAYHILRESDVQVLEMVDAVDAIRALPLKENEG